MRLVGIFALLAFVRLTGADAVDADSNVFRRSFSDESYMVIVSESPGERFAARFEVLRDKEGEYLTRVVTLGESQLSVARLPKEESAALLQRFRSFDWNAKATKRALKGEFAPGCVFGSTPQITFKARVEETYREIKGDGSQMPSLADLLEVFVSKTEQSSQQPEPMPGSGRSNSVPPPAAGGAPDRKPTSAPKP